MPALCELPAIDVSALWRFPLGDELVVAREDIHGLFLLNSSARIAWDEWGAGASLDEIAHKFAAVFALPLSVARRDIDRLLTDWSRTLLAPPQPPAGLPPQPTHALFGNSARVEIQCIVNGCGFRISLEPGDLVEEIVPRLAHAIVPHLPPGATVHTFRLVNGDDRVFVFRDGLCLAEEKKTSGARVILLQEMTRLCAPGRELTAILHAGACGTDSSCVILAGASHAGKSTLCAALMAQGLLCYGDDSAVVDRECRVAGMPFPLIVRKSSWPLLSSRLRSIEHSPIQRRQGADVRLLPSNLPLNGSPSVPAKALVFVDYQPDAKTRLQPLTAFESLLNFQTSGFWVKQDPASIERFLAWISGLERFRLTYSSIEDAVETLGSFVS